MGMDFLSDLLAAVERSALSFRFNTIEALLAVWLLARLAARRGAADDAVQKTAGQRRAIFSAPHEFAPVRAHDFRWLDGDCYDQTQRLLESIGFQCFGDVENLSLSAVYPNMRTAIRDFASGDGVVSASIRQVKMRGWLRVLALLRMWKGDVRAVDFGTEFSDGTFLATANNRGLNPSGEVPGIEIIQLPNATPIEEAVVIHRRRVAEIITQRPGVVPVPARTARAVREAAARAHALKCGQDARNSGVDSEQFAGVAAEMPWLAYEPETRAMARELGRIRGSVS